LWGGQSWLQPAFSRLSPPVRPSVSAARDVPVKGSTPPRVNASSPFLPISQSIPHPKCAPTPLKSTGNIWRSQERETILSGNVSCGGNGQAHWRKSRLKAGCSQDWLPHRAGRLTIGRRLPTCPTNRRGENGKQSRLRVSGECERCKLKSVHHGMAV